MENDFEMFDDDKAKNVDDMFYAQKRHSDKSVSLRKRRRRLMGNKEGDYKDEYRDGTVEKLPDELLECWTFLGVVANTSFATLIESYHKEPLCSSNRLQCRRGSQGLLCGSCNAGCVCCCCLL